jgi:hypothetical protein
MTSINRAFLTITCAAATMTAILLVSSGDALARKPGRGCSAVPPPVECGSSLRKANRNPDLGGQVVKRKITPGGPYVPGHFYDGSRGISQSQFENPGRR